MKPYTLKQIKREIEKLGGKTEYILSEVDGNPYFAVYHDGLELYAEDAFDFRRLATYHIKGLKYEKLRAEVERLHDLNLDCQDEAKRTAGDTHWSYQQSCGAVTVSKAILKLMDGETNDN